MKRLVCLFGLIAVLGAAAVTAAQPIALWKFNEVIAGDKGAKAVRDDVGGRQDTLLGNAWLVTGVAGQALQLDGITAHIVRKAEAAPHVSGPFTLEAWVAIGAYPFNWCPIFQQQDGEKAGYFFGIGDKGQVAFHLAAGGTWQGVETKDFLPLRSWIHLAGVYEPAKGVTLYINGRPAAAQSIAGEFIPTAGAGLWIGRNMKELEQTAPVSKNRQYPTRILFDGIIDELAISSGVKSAEEIAADYASHKPEAAPPLPQRMLPAGPVGPGPFGAFYTRLKYYKGWDDYWRVGDAPDVVVRFDGAPYRFVFWRGTSYIPHWVTENGIWYDNEFTESFQSGLRGSAEPMSDKQCRFSHVRILESNSARVVVHWRYAPVDVAYTAAYVDPLTGWGDWTDEIHTLYPDGIGVRKITVHTSGPMPRREWHEGIVVMGPGMSPNDAIEPGGLTLVNEKGDTHTYFWEKKTPPKKPTDVPDANIQLINTKSKYKPFTAARTADKPWFDVYAGEIRRDVSIYPWWNHWPTAFEPSNGRYAQSADRASHSSLTHLHWEEYTSGENWATKILLQGMTDRAAVELATIARSWEKPAQLRLETRGFTGGDFDPGERAYLLERAVSSTKAPLVFTLASSAQSPVHNLPLVIKNWGETSAALVLNGKRIPQGADFRSALRQRLEGTDLIVWVRIESTQPLRLTLEPQD